MSSTVLAIGAHIGDADLSSGPLLAHCALAGHRTAILALTPGERGHPRLGVDEYREQKLSEGRAFASRIGAEFRVFDDLSDGFLTPDDSVAVRVAEVIRDIRPDVVVAHWRHSIHSDHSHASALAERGRFLAGLPGAAATRHGVRRVLYAENWEDDEGFQPSVYVPISDEAFSLWHDAISGAAFARGETYGFRYIDYYTALMTMRGCLSNTSRAVALSSPTPRQALDLG